MRGDVAYFFEVSFYEAKNKTSVHQRKGIVNEKCQTGVQAFSIVYIL